MSSSPSDRLTNSAAAALPAATHSPLLAADGAGHAWTGDRPAIRRDEALLHALWEQVSDALILFDGAGRCQHTNPAAQQLFGMTASALQGCPLATVVGADAAAAWQSLPDAPTAPTTGELQWVQADGTVRSLQYTLTAHVFPDRHLLSVRAGTAATPQEQAGASRIAALEAENQALRATNQQLSADYQTYQTLFELLPIGVLITDAEGRWRQANTTLAPLLGIAPTEPHRPTLEQLSQQAVYPDGRPMPTAATPGVQAWREQRVIQGVEQGIRQADGTVRWLAVSAAPIPLADYGVAIAYLDITAHKQTEAALRQTRDQYRRATQAGVVGVWDWTLETNEIYLDPILKQLLGYADTDIRNHIDDWGQYVYAEDRPAVMAAATAHLEGRSPEYRVEHRMVHRDGSLRWFLARGVALRSPDGTPYRMLGTDIDITAHKQTELALQRQSQQEQAFNTVVQAVRSSLDLETIFSRSVAAISALLHVEVSIVQYLPDTACWRHLLVYNQGTQSREPLTPDVPDTDNPFAAQLKQLQAVRVNDTAQITDPINQKLAETAPGAWLLVPIALEGQVWGSLTLGKTPPPQPWTEAEVALAQRVAAQLAIAIHQANLYHQLQAASERDALVVQSIGEGVWDFQPTTQVATVSARYWEILGYDNPASPETTPTAEFGRIHPADHDRVYAAFRRHLEQGDRYDLEFRMAHRAGHYIWIRERGQAIWDAQGQPVRMVGTIEDVSDRKQAEAALQESEAFRRKITDLAPVAIYIYDLDQEMLTFCNPTYEATLGYTLEEIQAMGAAFLPTLYHPSDRARIEAYDQALWNDRDGRISDLEYACRRKDGSTLLIYTREVVLNRHPDGTPAQILGLGIDVTARKQMELALQQREHEFRALAENAPDCIMRCDRHYRFLYVNPMAAQISGMPSAAYIGKTSAELGFPADLVALWQGAMEHVFSTGQEQAIEYALPPTMGGSVYHARIVPEIEASGTVVSVLKIARDITLLKQAQTALAHQADRERTLRLMTQHIRQTLDLNTILSVAVSEVQRTLQADRTLVFRFQTDRSGVVVQEAVRSAYASILGRRVNDACFLGDCYDIYQQGQARIVSAAQLAQWGDCLEPLVRLTGLRSKMVAPITQQTATGTMHLWGLLITHACGADRQWQPDELDLLQQIAEQLAIALQQSELHHQVQQWANTLEQQVQERTATLQQSLNFEALLTRITDRVRDSLDEDQILDTAVRELCLQLDLDCCDTGIYNDEQTTSTITHEFTRSIQSAKGATFEIATAMHQPVYRNILAGVTSQFCDRRPCSLRPDTHKLAVLACPIRDDQATLGDMWLIRQADQAFSAPEVRLVEQVANQCAIALRQARLFKATQMQVLELERLHQLKDDFLSTVSHELRTPMANIKMSTEMLEIQLKRRAILPENFPVAAEQSGAIATYFNILKLEGKREIALINDLLDLTRLDARTEPLDLTPINLHHWLPFLLESFVARTQQQQQTLSIHLPPDLPNITTDLSYLQRILSELLNNACKYTPPGEAITLQGGWQPAEQPPTAARWMQFTLTNTGVEIPPAERDRIFDRFYRIPNGDPWKHGGTGLGLALVKAMVEYLSGRIWVEADHGETRFIVQLPRSLESEADTEPTATPNT